MTLYFSSKRFISRLTKEWIKHKNIIIGVDFDDTVKGWYFKKFNYNKVLNLLKECSKYNALIVPFTAREPERWDEIYQFFNNHGIPIQKINKTPDVVSFAPFGKHSKIYANIFLDDRGGFTQSLYILKKSLKKYKKNVNNIKTV